MKRINETVQGLLLKDAYRKAGSKEIDGKLVEWDDGYIISLLLVGGASAVDIKKYTVRSDHEDTIKMQLADVEWGSMITLSLEDGKVVEVKVETGNMNLFG
jgi:major membrane immunogen (membrane-anchored lipoprotein)